MEIVLLGDSELVERALCGDSSAYEALFERHRSSLRAMLQSRCSGDDAVLADSYDDILQEAFVKAYLNLEKFDPKYSFAQWIFGIARNLFIDYTRRNSHIEKCSLSADIGGVCSAPNPEEQVIAAQYNRRLREAFERLSPAYRVIVELRFWCDMSYEQISEKLQLPLGTVKTQIHRARQAFIRELGTISL